MTATRLIFVRHGESVHAVEDYVGGPRTCRGLTATGRDQARDLGRRLRAEKTDVAAVYSSTLRRATETAAILASALDAEAVREDCGLCTWHTPDYADGMPKAEFTDRHAVPGGGVFRPFQRDNETWAELVTRTSRAILDIADRHRGATALIAGHSETVAASFHALGLLPPYRPFDLRVDPASVTEWFTDDDPTALPPARWTLARFNAPA